MQIQFLVRMLMMVAVMRRPPQGAALGGAGTQHCEYKLGRTAGLEGFVGKITVIETRYCKHAHHEERNRKPDGESAHAGVKGQQTGQVQRDKRDYPQNIEGSRGSVDVIRTGLGIEPPQNVCKPVLHSGHTLIALPVLLEPSYVEPWPTEQRLIKADD